MAQGHAPCPAASRSGSSSRRCCADRRTCCCWTSRTTTSTCPPSAGWRTSSIASPKTVLFVCHDRELLDRVATRIATLEPGAAGGHDLGAPGPVLDLRAGPRDRNDRLEELRQRWDEEHAKLKALVVMYRQKAAYNADMAPRLQAARDPAAAVRGGRAARGGAVRQNVRMRLRRRPHGQAGGDLRGARAGRPDAAVRPRGLVRRAGGGARLERVGQVATSCGCWRRGGSGPRRRAPAGGRRGPGAGGAHRRRPARLAGAARLVRPDPRAPGAARAARCSRSCTAATSTGPASRARRRPGRWTATSWPGRRSRRSSRCPAGSRRGSRSCCSSCRGATLLLLDEPTDNLDLHSAEALEEGLDAFEGTVLAVTHDRWFARGFDRYLVFGAGRAGLRVDRAGLGRGPGAPGALTAALVRTDCKILQKLAARALAHRRARPSLSPPASGVTLLLLPTATAASRTPAGVPTRWRVARPAGCSDPLEPVVRSRLVLPGLLAPLVALPAPRPRRSPRAPPPRPHRTVTRGRLPAVRARLLGRLAARRARPPTSPARATARRTAAVLAVPAGSYELKVAINAQLGRELRRRRRQGRRATSRSILAGPAKSAVPTTTQTHRVGIAPTDLPGPATAADAALAGDQPARSR